MLNAQQLVAAANNTKAPKAEDKLTLKARFEDYKQRARLETKYVKELYEMPDKQLEVANRVIAALMKK